MRFPRPLVPARFIRRVNRFAALVEVDGRPEQVHVRNSGRLHELLRAGRQVLLLPAETPERRTRFTLAVVRLPGRYVSVDAHLPNFLVADALGRRAIAGLRGYNIVRREPAIGRHRADFLLAQGKQLCLVEVKSVTLVKEGIALFPDAPTLRGRAHLEHLIAARRRGLDAAILFVVQRKDARAFAPNRNADPGFAESLLRASRGGVCIRAITCHVTPRDVRLARILPVLLDHRASRLGEREKQLTPCCAAD